MTTTPSTPVLHMVCGKIGAGKSTLARRLAAAPATVACRVWAHGLDAHRPGPAPPLAGAGGEMFAADGW